MLERDYFLRIIQEFAVALTLFMEKKVGEEKRDQELKELYRQYVGPYETVRNLSTEEMLEYARDQWNDEQRMDRIEMVAELLYAEASYKVNPLREMLLTKAFHLFDYVDVNGTTYSMNRKTKMKTIQQSLHHEQHE